MAKWPYLHPRTSTTAIRLDEYIDSEVKDRRWHPDEWSGDSARRVSTGRKVLESRREWLDKALENRKNGKRKNEVEG